MQEVLKKFGRYFLLDQVAQGGMAEIFRVRQISSEGLGRILVIKRIQSSYGTNSEFLSMFRSETKVMMNFNHPNIVQLQDYGEEQGQPFIAMEYVEGRSLRQLRDRFYEKTGKMPPELAAYLVGQAAAGLYYAHVFKDRMTGQPLNIVHRDVSPQNILVSYDGNVKIIDFGIAKASINSEQTRAGVIKGKIGYLSPEQINPSVGPLDGRSDLFSLGIVLWELLTGRKLFTADNEIAVLRMIEKCNTTVRPPSEINSSVPKELDAIVMQALSKNRDQRFAHCLEFQKRLQKFLVQFSPEFNPTDIGGEIKSLFANEIVEDRKNLQRLSERAQNLLSLENVTELRPRSESNLDEGTSLDRGSTGSRNFESTQVDVRASVKVDVPIEAPVRTQSKPQTRSSSSSSRPTGSASNQYSGSNSRQWGPPKAVRDKSGSPSFGMAAVIALVGLGLWSMYGGQSTAPRPDGHQNPKARMPSGQEQMAVRLQISPVGGMAQIKVNGKSLGENGGAVIIPTDGPLMARVPLSESVVVTVEANGFKPIEFSGAVDPQKLTLGAYGKEFQVPLTLEPEVFGVLRYRSGIANASLRVEIGGQNWVYKSGLTGGTEVVKLPPGTYRLEFFSSSLNMSQVIPAVTIQAGGSIDQDVILRK
ncbi:serine/threonine protein kinase [bacterium]|nr:serine/threonine protein kinase [bacterium]